MNFAYGFQEQGPDPNSPGTFKQNIQITLEYIATLREHVRQALAGMYVEGLGFIFSPNVFQTKCISRWQKSLTDTRYEPLVMTPLF